ncbi:hypothetical protein AB0D84_31515 [Streptomyces sp. NPDC048193]|uniref:hypothetical protein n=1 Tax=unclassified Streptomyces TaxID=2593676 RepID=UPI00343AEFF0
MDKLIDLLVIATIAWRLTNLSRDRADRADRAAEKGSLRTQADALIVAVLDLRHAAAVNRILWEWHANRVRETFPMRITLSDPSRRLSVKVQ